MMSDMSFDEAVKMAIETMCERYAEIEAEIIASCNDVHGDDAELDKFVFVNRKRLVALRAAIDALKQASAATCTWHEWEDETWSTSCGELWSFNEGGPEDNSALFCYHCGKRIKAEKYQPESEEE